MSQTTSVIFRFDRRSRQLCFAVLVALIACVTPLIESQAEAMWFTPKTALDRVNSSTTQSVSPGRAIFSDDFETYGDSSLWSAEYPFPVQSDNVANGSFAARLTNHGGTPVFGRKTLDQPYPRLFARIRFQVLAISGPPTILLNFRPTQTTSTVAIRIDAQGVISYETGATGITSTSTVKAEPDAWHELQVLVDTTSNTGNMRIWLDNAELTSMRQNAWLGENSIHFIDLGDNSAGLQTDIAFDDVIVSDEFISPDRQAAPVAGTLVVNTFPAWGHIPFKLDGKTFYSDANGKVVIQVDRWSTDLRARIKVGESYQDDGSQASFTGSKNWHSVHSRNVDAAFQISEPVTFSFVDANGIPVDPSTIDSITIKSNTGLIQTFNSSQLQKPVLVTTSSVALGPAGMESRTAQYVVDEVMVGGSNAVHRAQQRSSFDVSRQWTVSLLFYRVSFSARDAFYGSSLGTEIVLRASDGTEQRVALDVDGNATIDRLPRGEYTVSVMNAGYSPPRPIHVSRDQDVQLKVVSMIDVASLMLTVGAVFLGLILIGRPFLITRPTRTLVRVLSTIRLDSVRGIFR